jgi:hypothetical protein
LISRSGERARRSRNSHKPFLGSSTSFEGLRVHPRQQSARLCTPARPPVAVRSAPPAAALWSSAAPFRDAGRISVLIIVLAFLRSSAGSTFASTASKNHTWPPTAQPTGSDQSGQKHPPHVSRPRYPQRPHSARRSSDGNNRNIIRRDTLSRPMRRATGTERPDAGLGADRPEAAIGPRLSVRLSEALALATPLRPRRQTGRPYVYALSAPASNRPASGRRLRAVLSLAILSKADVAARCGMLIRW